MTERMQMDWRKLIADAYSDAEDVRVSWQSGASSSELDELCAHVQAPLPMLLRELLAQSNGIGEEVMREGGSYMGSRWIVFPCRKIAQWYGYNNELLSESEVVPPGTFFFSTNGSQRYYGLVDGSSDAGRIVGWDPGADYLAECAPSLEAFFRLTAEGHL